MEPKQLDVQTISRTVQLNAGDTVTIDCGHSHDTTVMVAEAGVYAISMQVAELPYSTIIGTGELSDRCDVIFIEGQPLTVDGQC